MGEHGGVRDLSASLDGLIASTDLDGDGADFAPPDREDDELEPRDDTVLPAEGEDPGLPAMIEAFAFEINDEDEAEGGEFATDEDDPPHQSPPRRAGGVTPGGTGRYRGTPT